VVLGCRTPLVLRSAVGHKDNFYVVGECYVPGIICSETLLGPLQPRWSRGCLSNRFDVIPVYMHSNTRTQNNPILGPLPLTWRTMYGTWDEPQEAEAEHFDDMRRLWFENIEIGKKSNFDPRLTPEALRERGVDIQTFNLI
jgi:hypothetical protein